MKPTEEWRKLIYDLSDQTFFDLVRNYLGDIHTPFNKHKLLDKLEAFLLKPSNLDQIISMIDSSDASLLTAIDFLINADINQLYDIFRDEKPYYSFYTHLMNLEERMLICPAGGGKEAHAVVISPLFKDELEKRVMDFDHFLGCTKGAVKENSKYAWYDVPVIAAYISYLLAKKGRNTKKIPACSLAPEHGEIIKDILIKHSLIKQTGRHMASVKDNFEGLFLLDNEGISRFFINSYLSADPLDTLIYENMRPDRVYPEKAFARLVKSTAYMVSRDVGDIRTHRAVLVNAGLVAEDTAGLRKLVPLPAPGKGKIVVQPDFSLYTQGALDFEESITIAFFAEIRELDVINRWEVTKESFMRGIRAGIEASAFIRLLEKKSGAPLPQNILFSFKSWEEECRGIAVYRGCIIKVDSRFSNLLDNNSHFKRYIKEKLSDGIYLVPEDDFPSAMKVVENISGQSLALPEDTKPSLNLSFGLADYIHSRFQVYGKPAEKAVKKDISDSFLKKIETLDITPDQKDILADRVHRKLILSEDQLEAGGMRYELMEARGIDYTRKVRLCQHVLETGGSFLELSLGSEGTVLVKPLQLKKVGNDMLLEGAEIPEGAHIQVSVRKVRYMRKVRTSLMMG